MNQNNTIAYSEFIKHLIELRSRLIKALLSVGLLALVMLPFSRELYNILAQPLLSTLAVQNSQMIATGVIAPFLTPFKMTLIGAAFLGMPMILYQIWAFISPGLYKQEQRFMLPLLVGSIFLFYSGGAFVYYVIFPIVFQFLSGVAPEGVLVATDISSYLDFAIKMFFAFGFAFQVPILTVVLVHTEMVSAEGLSQKRPYVVVTAFILGMLLTPPDIISQTLLAIPIWILFELGLLISKHLQKRHRKANSIAPLDLPKS